MGGILGSYVSIRTCGSGMTQYLKAVWDRIPLLIKCQGGNGPNMLKLYIAFIYANAYGLCYTISLYVAFLHHLILLFSMLFLILNSINGQWLEAHHS